MLIIRKSAYMVVLLVLFASFLSGCGSLENDKSKEKIMPLTDVLKSDLTKVNSIDLQFDDGHKLSVTDSKTIHDIVSQIKNINVQETISKGVGYLYYLDLNEGNKTYRLNSNLTFGEKTYEATDDNAYKLNEFILKLGREKIPGLLPGVK
ncbi:hypothetical protein P5G61_02895 [Paenibacillus sp. F6_3S_P_1C]|uniref:Lipoprotein n=1 Tax=Paenibacillus vandeheii TaxID=3035917 RepID=A0ABT8J4Z4_9BACL|nr:hypothetical protein [Paenibacillus vandeheii]MDN4600161.1 hypothetical protein [Paenibacillus vandeheii]